MWSANEYETSIENDISAETTNYRQAPYIGVESECLPFSSAQINRCITQKRESSRDSEREEYDLEAQQVMTVWTRSMGQAAIIGMMVGFLGLGLIFVTFRETRKAAQSATRTYEAYIAVEGAKLTPLVCERFLGKTKGVINPVITFQNIGKSPAAPKKMIYSWLPSNVFPSEFDGIEEISPSLVETKKTTNVELIGERVDREVVTFLGGYVEYSDVVGREKKSYFCFRANVGTTEGPHGAHIYYTHSMGENWPQDT